MHFPRILPLLPSCRNSIHSEHLGSILTPYLYNLHFLGVFINLLQHTILDLGRFHLPGNSWSKSVTGCVLLASTRKRPKIKLTILQCTGYPTNKRKQSKMSIVRRWVDPAIEYMIMQYSKIF